MGIVLNISQKGIWYKISLDPKQRRESRELSLRSTAGPGDRQGSWLGARGSGGTGWTTGKPGPWRSRGDSWSLGKGL